VTGKLARYYASITYLDDQVGRVIQAVKDSGQFDNTIVILAGDNGLSLGEHGLLGKQNLYEFGGMHVPLVFAGPGIPKGESHALVYLYDVFATVCQLTGIPKPARVDGKSLAPITIGQTARVRDYALTAFKTLQRSVRDERWKLIRYPHINKTQLFDLQSDPHEMNDLSARPEYAEKLQAMMRLLQKAQRECGDTCPWTVDAPHDAAWSPDKVPAEKGKQPGEPPRNSR
jgi:arylsulfatase A-like enzyme